MRFKINFTFDSDLSRGQTDPKWINFSPQRTFPLFSMLTEAGEVDLRLLEHSSPHMSPDAAERMFH